MNINIISKPFRPKSEWYQAGWWELMNKLNDLHYSIDQSLYVEKIYHECYQIVLTNQHEIDYVAGMLGAAKLFDRTGFVVNENVT